MSSANGNAHTDSGASDASNADDYVVIEDRTDENWGTPGHLDENQTKALKSLREMLVTKNSKLSSLHDRHLLRFLRYKEFNADKAFAMIENHSQFREQHKSPDGKYIKEDFPLFVEDHMNRCLYLAGEDKKGRPVIVIKASKVYPARYTIEEVYRFILFYTDELFKIGDEKDACELSGIGDLENWSLRHNFSLDFALALLNLQANHFPETAGKIYLVNLPWSFNVALKMIKPFIDPRIMYVFVLWNYVIYCAFDEIN